MATVKNLSAKRRRIARSKAKEQERLKERKRHRKYVRVVGGKKVFGKKVPSRMLRISAKYAAALKVKAKKKGMSIPEYTATLVK